jgi:hypothetical protein
MTVVLAAGLPRLRRAGVGADADPATRRARRGG